jgi:hypothetical protein
MLENEWPGVWPVYGEARTDSALEADISFSLGRYVLNLGLMVISDICSEYIEISMGSPDVKGVKLFEN